MKKTLPDTAVLPLFHSINPLKIELSLDALLQEIRSAVADLLDQPISWEDTLQVIESLYDRLNRFWSPVRHLHAVADTEDLRQAYNACLPKLTNFYTEMGQNQQLYLAYKKVFESAEFATLSEAQQKIVENALLEFKLSGITLDTDEQEQYRKIQEQLLLLQNSFEENLLDATHAWKKHVQDPQLVQGLPQSVLAVAEQRAQKNDLQGWLFVLDFPIYLAVMQYAEDAALREEFYVAYVTRASDQGEHAQWDNSALMQDILRLRHEQARLLGYDSFAHYSLARKMADNVDQVLQFIHDLAQRTKAMAQQELQELQEFATKHFGQKKLQAWDVAFYSEKLRQHKYNISLQQLRPYFPVQQVLDGLFAITSRLYGICIQERQNVEAWHADVRFFDIYDDAGNLRAGFYLDVYARDGKQSGAWMDECMSRSAIGATIQLPVAFITCNFTPVVVDKPSLLTHDEVVTLFHEFGHGLHHMLTLVDYPSVAGIAGVAWDAVELPSQLMENWCWQRQALDLFARHYESGQLIDAEMFEKLCSTRNFQAGLQMLRQLEFALFDFNLHLAENDPIPCNIQSVLDQVRKEIAVVFPPSYNRFQNSFSHIFAGGYAAGYYSYKWAEVLSADVFSKFATEGILNPQTGKRFLQTVLTQGGVKDPLDMFVAFMGREPKLDALLECSGLA